MIQGRGPVWMGGLIVRDKLKKKLLHRVGEAIADFGLIADGDRIMVCLSGGKDSFTLLALLRDLQPRAPVHFDLLVVTLDQGQPGFRENLLTDYLEARNVPYRIVRRDTYSVVQRVVPSGKTTCALCSRLRRGVLYNIAAEEGCTKIALGHHADDVIQTFLLNLFFGGSIKAMPSILKSEDGRNTVIRPMAYCWESDIALFASRHKFPVIPCVQCSAQPHLMRKRMKSFLDELEKEIPNVRNSLLAALGRIVSSHLMIKPG